MKDIYIGIFHKDYQYGKRLMEYLNHQKEFPMTAWFTSDEKSFFDKENNFQCLILEDGVEYRGKAPVCRVGCNKEYCQSGKEIAQEIYHCLNVKRGTRQMIFGTYSPVPRYEVSQFARRLAGEHGWVYFGMQAYPHCSEDEDSGELLLFYVKEHNDRAVDYFLSRQESMKHCKGYPGVGCYLDFRQLSGEDYRWFFEELKKEQISVLFDIGAACPPDLHFFELFDKIYLPLMRGDQRTSEYRLFKDQMQHHGIWYQTEWEEVIFTANRMGKEGLQ